ncbi:unannotated protein [freshwater metagenome]|uniref:Unannotated protein n=1 Tax=freshwater metagenome TaxID=449393 RepID=A0A6J7HUI2_9ZZZZ
MRGFWAQVVNCASIFNRANGGAQHAVEVAWFGEFTLIATVGAGDVSKTIGRRLAVLVFVLLDQLISTPATVALFALGQRIDECVDVT